LLVYSFASEGWRKAVSDWLYDDILRNIEACFSGGKGGVKYKKIPQKYKQTIR
jgi:hypothetical protein